MLEFDIPFSEPMLDGLVMQSVDWVMVIKYPNKTFEVTLLSVL